MKRIPVLLSAVLLALGAHAGEPESRTFDLGFIASRQVDVNGDIRLRVLGPFFESAESPRGDELRAFRPFYARAQDPAAGRTARDIVWPIASAKRFRQESSWRFLITYHQRFDVEDPHSRYRFWFIPIYFQGRDKDGEKYIGVFPLGGRIHEFLGRDWITFVLFPLYISHAVNEVHSSDWLWPIYSRTEGKGIYRIKVFPFYGRSRHREKFEKKFILWPIWTWARYNYEGSSGTGYILFPLWGHLKLTDQESWMFLPPFFRFHRGERLNYVYAPWPFYQRSRGEIEKLYFAPFYGRKHMRGVDRTFYLWPVFWKERVDLGDTVRRRFLALPVYYSQVKRSREQPGDVLARYHQVWPLGSYRREDKVSRFRMLSLWPLMDSAPVERSWAPLWTLYERTAVGDAVDSELLWGLYRHSRRGDAEHYISLFPFFAWRRDDGAGETREWSVLKGLAGYQREGGRKTLRLLYLLNMRMGDKGEERSSPTRHLTVRCPNHEAYTWAGDGGLRRSKQTRHRVEPGSSGRLQVAGTDSGDTPLTIDTRHSAQVAASAP